MNEQEIRNYIAEIIKQSRADQEIENPKIDCKSKWYDLKTGPGLSEFLKDTSSIANTVGLDGFIIIGYNDKTKEFRDADFKESGLRDSSEIYSIIVKNVDSSFDISLYTIKVEEHFLNVIHIPPSLQKPHVIRRHQTFHKNGDLKKDEPHRIFVRKNTSIYEANKYDIDLMYYDRKNIIPEHEVHAVVNMNTLGINIRPAEFRDNQSIPGKYHGDIGISIENTGRRPISLLGIEFNLVYNDGTGKSEVIQFRSTDIYSGSVIRSQDIASFYFSIEGIWEPNFTAPKAHEKIHKYMTDKKKVSVENLIIHTTNNYHITARINPY